MFCILFYNRQDASCDNSMCSTEVMINFYIALAFHASQLLVHADLPCRVNVIDCSSFSSSSVNDRLRDDATLDGRDIVFGELHAMWGVLLTLSQIALSGDCVDCLTCLRKRRVSD